MKHFDIGEHVVCSVTTRQNGTLVEVTPRLITIYKPDGTVDINSATLSRDGVGEYHYDYDTTGRVAGYHKAKVTLTLVDRVTIKQGGFTLSQ